MILFRDVPVHGKFQYWNKVYTKTELLPATGKHSVANAMRQGKWHGFFSTTYSFFPDDVPVILIGPDDDGERRTAKCG